MQIKDAIYIVEKLEIKRVINDNRNKIIKLNILMLRS